MYGSELQHYGVLGMKWGRRTAGQPSARQVNRELQKRAPASKAAALKKLSSMSDTELKALVDRINLEQRYKAYLETMYPKRKSIVRDFTKVAGKQLMSAISKKATEQIAANIVSKIQTNKTKKP